METRENAGYKIIKTIELPYKEIVLGEKITQCGTKYVTWICFHKKDYYYGHYIDNSKLANLDLYKRAKDEINFILSQLEN